MKSDIREAQFRLTDARIRDGYLDLLTEKDINRITVKDVCERSGISRGTFYLHYEDINALLHDINSWYVQRAVPFYEMEFNSFGAKPDREKLLEGVRGHLSLLASWPKYAVTVFGRDLCPWVSSEIMSICQQRFEGRVPRGDTQKLMDYEYEFAYVANGVVGIMKKWCRDGLTAPLETVVRYIAEFVLTSHPESD